MKKILKTRIEVIGIIVASIVSLITVTKLFFPYMEEEAELEVVDFIVNDMGESINVNIKLRNIGNKVAFLKKGEMIIGDSNIQEITEHAASEVYPVKYNWLISNEDLQNSISNIQLSRKIDPDDVDSMNFTIAWEKVRSTLNASARINLKYNKDQLISMPKINFSISNLIAGKPKYILPKSPDELVSKLNESISYYTAQQIIDELSRVKYKPAESTIIGYISSSNKETQRSAILYYSQIKSKKSIPKLVEFLINDDPYISEAAYKAIIFQGDESINEIAKLLENSNPSHREIAVNLLGKIKGQKAKELLIKQIEDRGIAKINFGKNILVLASVLRSLGNIEDKKTRGIIIKYLDDPNDSVKLAATEALKTLNHLPSE